MNKAFLPRFLLYFVLSVFGLPFSPSVPQWSSLVREHVVVSAEMTLELSGSLSLMFRRPTHYSQCFKL